MLTTLMFWNSVQGVFLYMGLTTLGCNQFWNRILLFFMEPSKYTDASDEPFIENVATYRIHVYTGIQLFLFVLLYAVKSIKPIAIAFPIVIAACIPVRLYILPKIFSADELILMDSGDEELIDRWLEDNGKNRRVRIVQHHSLEEEPYHQSICGDLPFENQSLGMHSLGLRTLGAHTV
jgi:HCO3- transporter family